MLLWLSKQVVDSFKLSNTCFDNHNSIGNKYQPVSIVIKEQIRVGTCTEQIVCVCLCVCMGRGQYLSELYAISASAW